MSIWFFSDPHLGLMRTSHTTQASRMRLREALYTRTEELFHIADGPVYCLGDLFDTEANDEASILQGYQVASWCAKVLAGNHDLPNREGKLSSLQLISEMVEVGQIVLGKVDEPGFAVGIEKEAVVYFVPHMATQALFDISLGEVGAYALNNWKQTHPGKSHILCLHCNYDSGFIHNDASLNLSWEKADSLLETFDYILLGHEHMPRTLHNGRLIILGNTHPTSFSDLSDKAIWEFNGREFISWPIWSMSEGYREVQWDDDYSLIPDSVQFVDVVGTIPSERASEVAAGVAGLWKNRQNLLMVRNNVVTARDDTKDTNSFHKSLDLPSRISEALKDTELNSIWMKYYKEV